MRHSTVSLQLLVLITQFRIVDLQPFLDNQSVCKLRVKNVLFSLLLRDNTVPDTKEGMFVNGRVNNLKND